MASRRYRFLAAAAVVTGGLGAQAAANVVAATQAGATPAITFSLSPCPGSGATGSGSVTISQTAKSLTIVDRVTKDLPDAGDFMVLVDVSQADNVFGGFPLDNSGSALFEVHTTTTLPTGVLPGDSIVLAAVQGDNFVPRMASDPDNCPG